ncbi:MAG: hypothetical protein R3242_06870 [Akkermansiaceae bacterium]|nr:hypothetical protein [Akkermansiaceae bacterium]
MPDSDSPETAGDKPTAVNYEQSEEVRKMIAEAPHALPLPARLLVDNQLSVGDIPAGILLTEYCGDLDVRVSRQAPKFRKSSPVPAADPFMEKDHSLMRAPLEATNRGKNPKSRRYIRGVLHPHPWALATGAISTLLLVLALPATVVAVVLLSLSERMPERFEWVPAHLLWVPVALLLVGLLYLTYGLSGRCRVCNHRLFVYQSRFKNEKSHHLPGLGHVLPLCLHLLLFRWFRCSHCGTSIRIKK